MLSTYNNSRYKEGDIILLRHERTKHIINYFPKESNLCKISGMGLESVWFSDISFKLIMRKII